MTRESGENPRGLYASSISTGTWVSIAGDDFSGAFEHPMKKGSEAADNKIDISVDVFMVSY
jgi:hypothetical protein